MPDTTGSLSVEAQKSVELAAIALETTTDGGWDCGIMDYATCLRH